MRKRDQALHIQISKFIKAIGDISSESDLLSRP